MRIEQLTFTRFIAAMAIIVYHYGALLTSFSNYGIETLVHHANIGVSYFFILSGFVMILAYKRRQATQLDAGKYYINRVARIYPVYFIALLLVIVYRVIRHFEVTPVDAVLHIAGLQSWFPQYVLDLNTPGWSLSVEFLFYLSFPFLFNRVYQRYSLRQLIVPVILFWLASQALFHYFMEPAVSGAPPSITTRFLFYFPLLHLNQFVIGNVACLFFLQLEKKHYRNYDGPLVLLTALILLLLNTTTWLNFHNGLLALLIVPFLLLLCLNTGYITKLFSKKAAVFLGEISYGIYILQKPVYLYSDGIFKTLYIHNKQVVFVLYVLALLVTSALFYLYIEVPLRDRIKNFKLPRLRSVSP